MQGSMRTWTTDDIAGCPDCSERVAVRQLCSLGIEARYLG